MLEIGVLEIQKEIIACHEILTKVYKLKKEDLYVTIFEGNKDDNLIMRLWLGLKLLIKTKLF